MTIEAAEIRRLAKLVGWPVEKQKSFLKANGDREWDTAKESTVSKAMRHLKETAKMFGVKIAQRNGVKLYDPNKT